MSPRTSKRFCREKAPCDCYPYTQHLDKMSHDFAQLAERYQSSGRGAHEQEAKRASDLPIAEAAPEQANERFARSTEAVEAAFPNCGEDLQQDVVAMIEAAANLRAAANEAQDHRNLHKWHGLLAKEHGDMAEGYQIIADTLCEEKEIAHRHLGRRLRSEQHELYTAAEAEREKWRAALLKAEEEAEAWAGQLATANQHTRETHAELQHLQHQLRKATLERGQWRQHYERAADEIHLQLLRRATVTLGGADPPGDDSDDNSGGIFSGRLRSFLQKMLPAKGRSSSPAPGWPGWQDQTWMPESRDGDDLVSTASPSRDLPQKQTPTGLVSFSRGETQVTQLGQPTTPAELLRGQTTTRDSCRTAGPKPHTECTICAGKSADGTGKCAIGSGKWAKLGHAGAWNTCCEDAAWIGPSGQPAGQPARQPTSRENRTNGISSCRS